MAKRVRLTSQKKERIGNERATDKKRSSKDPSNETAPIEREDLSDKGDYKVGRGKPPLHTRFKKGDGRIRPGRTPGSKNIATLVLEAARDQIAVTIDGKKRKISKAQSAAIQLANAGAMGNPKLLVKFIDLIAEIEARAEAARPSEYPFSDFDVKVIREVYGRLRPYGKRTDD